MTRTSLLVLFPLVLFGCTAKDVTDDSSASDDTSGSDDTSAADDTASAECTAPVTVSNSGSAIAGDYALTIDVSPFPGAADDLSNVKVLDGSGTELPRWIASASGGAGVIRAVVTDLPAGDTDLTLDACTSDAQPNAVEDVLPFLETFTGGLGPHTIECERVQSDGSGGWLNSEECEYNHAEEGGDGFLHTSLMASCYRDPYDGAAVALRGTAHLSAGDYRLSLDVRTQGELYDFCSGTGHLFVVGSVGGNQLFMDDCEMTGCGACALDDWRIIDSPLYTSTGGDEEVYVRLQAHDCALGELDLSEVSLERVVDPAPVATQGS
ncbi:MAG: hypothetical protein H6739_13110 [Alphaproteobacteria bacterium]|nr:hypothetical protein [Alphaproteobacteria bacterium]